MAIIKAPPKQPKSVTIQARVEESVKTQLDQYAKFIDSAPSYVITEALKVLFKRDDEFKAWLRQHANDQDSDQVQGEALITNMKSRPTQFGTRENKASARQHAPRLTMNASVLQSDPFSATQQPDKGTHELVTPIKETFELSLTEPPKWATGGKTSGTIASGLCDDKRPTVERPLTCEEAAAFVRVHPRTVKRMARVGKVPGHFRFGRWYFYASELDCWMRMELHSARHP